MKSYPHMCRDEHVEIGHADNSGELCPLCRANGRIESLEIQLKKAENRHVQFMVEGGPVVMASDFTKIESQLAQANEKLAAYEQAHPPADLPPQTAIQTENCCVCGKQTVYKCPWDHRQLCGEITCRKTHEERGECSRTGSAPPPSEKGKP